MYINKGQMKADAYIKKTREYLDYLEEHIENVRKAFSEISDKCRDMFWVSDDYQWHTFRYEVTCHDLSKLSEHEFIQYRKAFYPVEGEFFPVKDEFFPVKDEPKYSMNEAWEHHKSKNTHHHETVKGYMDVVHMVIDWTAMGYKFGDTAQQYYEKNKDKISLSEEHEEFMYDIFSRLRKE